jgi:GT2 family glycosyltransferase
MMRPVVSVICPLGGRRADVAAAVARLGRIKRGPGDEILLVDNTRAGDLNVSHDPDSSIRIVSAPAEFSSYYARNVGAKAAVGEWLLFLDSDCIPSETILDEYFAAQIPPECGAIAGGVLPLPDQTGLLVRYAQTRGILDQGLALRHAFRPYGATANLLVRTAAFIELNGFSEGIRSGGDADFCWRLQDRGWTLESQPDAFVHHLHRDDLLDMLRQFERYGKGRAWLRQRYPEAPAEANLLKAFSSAAGGIARSLARGRFESALFSGLDLALVVAGRVGSFRGNQAEVGSSAAGPTGGDHSS